MHQRRIAAAGGLTVALLVTSMSTVPAAATPTAEFEVAEATIASISDAFATGDLSCVELVQSYLDRIEAYDQPDGDELTTNAIQNVSGTALATAAELDAAYAADGPTGPLHCIPVLVKDQVETADMPTTYGSAIFKDFSSGRDATIVTDLREAGAVILAKTNLGEFAGGTAGSAFGTCRNPYDLTRSPSSSSCGTGAGVAANYGAVGIAEDTGGSTRGPAAWNNAVGLRPTTPLISRFGMVPASPTQDTLGPLTRSVMDAALLTNVIAGYDANDPLTAGSIGNVAEDYTEGLEADALEGQRIGIIREPLASDTDITSESYLRVKAVVDQAYADMSALGAEVVDPIEVPGLVELMSASGGGGAETETAIDGYLADLPNSPVATFRDIATSPLITPTRRNGLLNALNKTTDDLPYLQAQKSREELRQLVLQVMAEHDLDAVAHATYDLEPTVLPEDLLTNPDATEGISSGSNRSLSPLLGFPALTVPAGFTSASLPVGIDLLGRPYTEELLFELAYAYEQGTVHRTPSPDPAE